MPRSFEISVNPEVIKWARESAGFSIEEITRKIKTYEKIEVGERKPTFRQLELLSHLFKRPTSVFLLSEPPVEPSYSTSFRIMPKSEKYLSKELRLAIRKARYYQSVANELMKNLDVSTKPDITSASISEDPSVIARRERDRISISIEKQFEFKNAYMAFNEWRKAIENLNILVFQFRFPLEDARGFSLMDKEPPLIVLNTTDNILARIFTLFHEYAHILLEIPEIYANEQTLTNQNMDVENWCNEFASELLIPQDVLKTEKEYQDFIFKRAGLEVLNNLSNKFRVSKHAMLTRFRTLNLVTWEEYENAVSKIRSQYEKEKGVSFYLPSYKKCLQEKGKKFISLVMNSKKSGFITTAEAIEYLSLKLDSLKKVAESAGL
ncbi:MAG: ImmA/IrrE family metallo-endopeptidase [Bacteroidota bacterium]